ncbi:MAG: hypothetical protein QM737_08015 [Ferruginibacter sp.]
MLISFEGVGGAGKTSLSKKVKASLQKKGIEVILLGGFEIQKKSSTLTRFIRNELLQKDFFIGLPWLAETHLLISEFLYDMENSVLPALSEGKIVLYDSYWDSIYIYQLARAKINWKLKYDQYRNHLIVIEKSLINIFIPKPDIRLFINCDQEKINKRINVRNNIKLNTLEIETLKEIKKLYENSLITQDYKIIDNNRKQKDAVGDILKLLKY